MTASDYFDKYTDHVLSGMLILVALVCIALAFWPNHRIVKTAALAWLLIP
jgi:hypothetical protein